MDLFCAILVLVIDTKKAKLEEGFGSVWDMDTLYSPLTAQTCQHPFSKTKNFEWSTRRRGVPNWNSHIECHSWFQYVEKEATKETARAKSMRCMQPRSRIPHLHTLSVLRRKNIKLKKIKRTFPAKWASLPRGRLRWCCYRVEEKEFPNHHARASFLLHPGCPVWSLTFSNGVQTGKFSAQLDQFL